MRAATAAHIRNCCATSVGVPPAATPAVAAGGTPTEVAQQLRMWAAVAARKDFAAYEAFYAPTFTPAGGVSRAEWATTQRQRFAQAGNVPADLQNLTVRVSGLDRATAEFTQDYNDDQRREATRKTLELVKVGNNWLINRESAVAANRK